MTAVQAVQGLKALQQQLLLLEKKLAALQQGAPPSSRSMAGSGGGGSGAAAQHCDREPSSNDAGEAVAAYATLDQLRRMLPDLEAAAHALQQPEDE